jgi:hypothetical protein
MRPEVTNIVTYSVEYQNYTTVIPKGLGNGISAETDTKLVAVVKIL